MHRSIARAGTLALSLALSGAAGAQTPHEGEPPEQLGEVNFQVSCTPDAQRTFNRAMALFHSFWFDPAKQAFATVLEQDPTCAMAHWGIAIMSMGNPLAWPPSPQALQAGANAWSQAQQLGAGSERENAYIDALGVFFKDWQSTEHRLRALALEQAMGEVAARYPQDVEAQVLYALLLNATAQPTDKTYANQLKAAGILEPLYRQYPNHPGIAHYLIHTFDYTSLAERGMPYARAYADIAPSVPHVQHMPSHIFSRVGDWPAMVESNLASYQAARHELQATTLDIGTYDALHALDYLVFGHLQQAQHQAAKQRVDEVAAIRKVNVENFVAAYAFAAIPARYALERGQWQEAAALQLSPADLAWDKFPQAEAILVFARGLGAARSGNPGAARADVERLQALQTAMRQNNLGYWADQAEFQIRAVNAWIAQAENRPDDALRLMREAADLEEASDKHPVTPGNVVPSRELLAELLVVQKQPAEAFAEFERSLQRDPNRLRATKGAMEAAKAAGNAEAARRYEQKVAVLTAAGDAQRAE